MRFSSESLASFSFLALLIFANVNANAADFITGEHQLSVKEKRAGEAYYRQDLKWMVYQAEVADDNPFYQIFLKNIDLSLIHISEPTRPY